MLYEEYRRSFHYSNPCEAIIYRVDVPTDWNFEIGSIFNFVWLHKYYGLQRASCWYPKCCVQCCRASLCQKISVMPALLEYWVTASVRRKTNWCINWVLMRVMDAVKEIIADISSVIARRQSEWAKEISCAQCCAVFAGLHCTLMQFISSAWIVKSSTVEHVRIFQATPTTEQLSSPWKLCATGWKMVTTPTRFVWRLDRRWLEVCGNVSRYLQARVFKARLGRSRISGRFFGPTNCMYQDIAHCIPTMYRPHTDHVPTTYRVSA